MRGLKKLIVINFKLFLREPEALFFTLVFPLLLVFLFGAIYGNEPTAFFGGRGTVDVSTPAYMAIIIAVTGLMSIPVSVATDREKGILRRLRATPIHPQTILTGLVTVHFMVTLLGALLLVVAGKIVFNLRFDGNILYFFLAFTFATFSFFALGFVIASLASTGRTANIIGMVFYFPMIFLSGATMPAEILPDGVRLVARFLPLTYVVQLLQGMWFGEPWGEHLFGVAVLAAMLIAGVIVAAKTFRWE